METLTPTYTNGQITQTENFSFLSQPRSSFLSISLPSLSFWGYSSGLLNTRIVRVPAIVHHHICFHFQQYLLKMSLLISHFIRQLPKWLSIFMTCYVGSTLSYKKATQLYASLSMHELNNRCAVNNYRQAWKEKNVLIGHW